MQPPRSVKVHFELEQDELDYPPTASESLWCTPTEWNTYIVDNIPFFAREISLGDEIRAKRAGKHLKFSGIVIKSKNSAVRVLLKKANLAERIRRKLESLGCGSELMDSVSLLAVTMPVDSQLYEALAFLDHEAEEQNIGIEESAVRYRDL